MYFKIISEKHTFQHNSSSKLIYGLPIDLHKVLLFYSNGRYYEYDLCSAKIVNSWMLPEKPIRISYLNNKSVLIMTESRKLVLLDLEKQSYSDITKLPKVITGQELKDRNTFFSTQIVPFPKSNTFYIKQTVEEDNKIRIIHFWQGRQSVFIKEFEDVNTIVEPLDEQSLVAIYRQFLETDKKWEIRIIDLMNTFGEKTYHLQHKAFLNNVIIIKTIRKSDNQIFIFVNGANPEILILNLQKGDITQFWYRPQQNLVDIGFYNGNQGVLCLFYLHYSQKGGEIYENLLELVNVNNAELVQKSYLSIRNPVYSLSKQFILDVPTEHIDGNTSVFYTRHFIIKKSLYFALMKKAKIQDTYGKKLIEKVIPMLS